MENLGGWFGNLPPLGSVLRMGTGGFGVESLDTKAQARGGVSNGVVGALLALGGLSVGRGPCEWGSKLRAAGGAEAPRGVLGGC